MGILGQVEAMEINEGRNVTEVLAAVSEGSNEVGVVYATDAASVADKVEVIAEAPADSLKTPVLYPAGLISDAEASAEEEMAAETFFAYLQEEETLHIFEEYGLRRIPGRQRRTGKRRKQKLQSKQRDEKWLSFWEK